MKRQFFTLDVFTDTRFGGNPLAVIMDGSGIDGALMQRVAREFNLSETVFVMPPESPDNRASIRIFTPFKELPFAGHPTVGTAVLLAELDGLQDGEQSRLVLEEQLGNVVCEVTRGPNGTNARFGLPKLPNISALNLDMDVLAAGMGLTTDQIGLPGHEITVCEAGVPFPMIPIVDLDAIGAIEINNSELARCMSDAGQVAEIYAYTKQCVGEDAHYHARMFAPAFGIAEDPATGSAVAAFAAQIMSFDHPGDGNHVFVIEQGFEMGRPSRITLHLNVSEGKLVDAAIEGGAIRVTEGAIDL